MADHKGYYSDLSSFVNTDQVLQQAQGYRDEALVAQEASETAQSAAKLSETNAAVSAASALDSRNKASDFANNSSDSASASSSSATAAATSESQASAFRTAASNSATASANSAIAAKDSETNSKTSETNSKTSETAAANSATAANTSRTNAATSATNAATSASNAANSASAAATSENNAATSASSANSSRLQASDSATASANSATASANSASNAQDSAAAASSAAAAVNLPPAAGNGGKMIRQRTNESGFEYVNGGIAIPSSGSDLNTLVIPGIYNQSSNSGAINGSNYPVPLAGHLLVEGLVGGDQICQTYKVFSEAATSNVGIFWIRTFYNGAWLPWRRYVSNSELVGQVSAFARPKANMPAGWLYCDGSNVSRVVYQELFDAIGTTYGAGDGSTTFKLPDLRGEFIRGWDDGRGIDSSRALGSYQTDTFESHTHTASTATAGSHTHTLSTTTTAAGSHNHAFGRTGDVSYAAGGGNLLITGTGTTSGTSTESNHVHSINGTTSSHAGHTHSVTVNSAGSSETRPRNMALMYFIKF